LTKKKRVRSIINMSIECLIEVIHQGQKRKTGEPYTSHLYATRDILKDVGITNKIILTTALLHDSLEDTYLTKRYLEIHFGQRVADIVDFVSKKTFWKTKYCKMKGSMYEIETNWNSYPEAMLVKMADRIHNLKTLSGFTPEKQKIYIKQTKEILLPLFEKIIDRNNYGDIQKPLKKLIQKIYFLLKKSSS